MPQCGLALVASICQPCCRRRPEAWLPVCIDGGGRRDSRVATASDELAGGRCLTHRRRRFSAFRRQGVDDATDCENATCEFQPATADCRPGSLMYTRYATVHTVELELAVVGTDVCMHQPDSRGRATVVCATKRDDLGRPKLILKATCINATPGTQCPSQSKLSPHSIISSPSRKEPGTFVVVSTRGSFAKITVVSRVLCLPRLMFGTM